MRPPNVKTPALLAFLIKSQGQFILLYLPLPANLAPK